MADLNADLRQKFEKEAKRYEYDLKRDGLDCYVEPDTINAYWGFQAAQPSSSDLEKLAREIAEKSWDDENEAKAWVLQLLTSTLGTK